jgi:hypothetical protein
MAIAVVVSFTAVVPGWDSWELHLVFSVDTCPGTVETLVALRVLDIFFVGGSMFDLISPVRELREEARLIHTIEVVVVVRAAIPMTIPRWVDFDGDSAGNNLCGLSYLSFNMRTFVVGFIVMMAFTPWLDNRHGTTAMIMAVTIPEDLEARMDLTPLLLSGGMLNLINPVVELSLESLDSHLVVVVTAVTGSVPFVSPVDPLRGTFVLEWNRWESR